MTIILHNTAEVYLYDAFILVTFWTSWWATDKTWNWIDKKIQQFKNRKKLNVQYTLTLGMKPKVRGLNVVYNGRLLKRGTDYRLSRHKTIVLTKAQRRFVGKTRAGLKLYE